MNIYHNLNNNIKCIFLIKSIWLIWLVLCNIYCIIILSLNNIIGQFCGFLLGTFILNTLHLPFTIQDVFTMLKEDKIAKENFVTDIIYGLFFFPILLCYYIFVAIGPYKLIGHEFIIILVYTIIYVVLIVLWTVATCSVLTNYIEETTDAIESREQTQPYEKVDEM